MTSNISFSWRHCPHHTYVPSSRSRSYILPYPKLVLINIDINISSLVEVNNQSEKPVDSVKVSLITKTLFWAYHIHISLYSYSPPLLPSSPPSLPPFLPLLWFLLILKDIKRQMLLCAAAASLGLRLKSLRKQVKSAIFITNYQLMRIPLYPIHIPSTLALILFSFCDYSFLLLTFFDTHLYWRD